MRTDAAAPFPTAHFLSRDDDGDDDLVFSLPPPLPLIGDNDTGTQMPHFLLARAMADPAAVAPDPPNPAVAAPDLPATQCYLSERSMSEKLSDMGEAQTSKFGNQVDNEQRNNEKSEAIEQQNALSDISLSEVQIIMDGSQDGNEETNKKKFKAREQEHVQPLSHVMAGDESPPKKRKFEGLSILKDIVHTKNKGVASRTRSRSKSKLVAKDRKIGTISRPIDSNDIMELDSIDCNDIVELDSDKEEEANMGVTTGCVYHINVYVQLLNLQDLRTRIINWIEAQATIPISFSERTIVVSHMTALVTCMMPGVFVDGMERKIHIKSRQIYFRTISL